MCARYTDGCNESLRLTNAFISWKILSILQLLIRCNLQFFGSWNISLNISHRCSCKYAQSYNDYFIMHWKMKQLKITAESMIRYAYSEVFDIIVLKHSFLRKQTRREYLSETRITSPRGNYKLILIFNFFYSFME